MESPGNPVDPGEAPAQASGKWALVRSLNQALKTFAVMPVSPGPGGEGSLAWASISGVDQKPSGLQELEGHGRLHPWDAAWD